MSEDINELLKYGEAINSMSKKAEYKLANFMAHGYDIDSTKLVTVIIKGKDLIVIDNEGNLIKGVKAF